MAVSSQECIFRVLLLPSNMAEQMLRSQLWRLDARGTAVEFGLLVGVPALHQMAPVGCGLIGKELSGLVV